MNDENMNNETFGGSPRQETPGVSSTPTYVTYVPYGYTPKTYEEKTGIKKYAVLIGVSLLLLMGITFFWGVLYYFIMSAMGISTAKANIIISDPAAMQVMQILLSSLMFTVPFILVFKANNQRISDLVPLKKPLGNKTAIFFIGLSVCAFANIANSFCGQLFGSLGIDYNVDFGDNPRGFFGFLLSLIATAVVPPLVEEFACRGIILGSLRRFGDGFAVLVSAILFGLMHGNFDQMPFAFMVGLALGFIVVKTDSLWIAVAVHAANNFISVAFEYLLAGLSQNAQNLIYSLYLMAALILGVIGAVLLSDREGFNFKKSDTESSLKQKIKWFFTSPVIIIFTVLCVLESLLYF
ncbi:MAG: type II CAAX endopeptidase family protein [Acutalibacteraceae bacterium]|nr:type II CAAX endopeptidase family protein [Acutalibacteraceae bacterium]